MHGRKRGKERGSTEEGMNGVGDESGHGGQGSGEVRGGSVEIRGWQVRSVGGRGGRGGGTGEVRVRVMHQSGGFIGSDEVITR